MMLKKTIKIIKLQIFVANQQNEVRSTKIDKKCVSPDQMGHNMKELISAEIYLRERFSETTKDNSINVFLDTISKKIRHDEFF